ncbi:MAG: hypothetical protein KDA41_06870 [Planctomycetales bacterium]|nr:hypothetical protein [Planctomycetales bacterium]
MANLTSPTAIWLKGILFLLLGLIAASLLIARNPEITSALLLASAIWAFCRAYYFAFYVIERYVDPTFRFAGLIDFARYALLGKAADQRDDLS